MATFRSRDLLESSLLYASQIKLSRLDKEGGRVWFVFEDKEKCETLARAYWNKEATVNAKAYSDALRTLKDLIFQER